jgi:hypothetical protein
MANLGLNFSELVYKPQYDFWAVDVFFTPLVGAPYAARGIFTTRALDVPTEDGAIFSDQETILDILEAEFPIIPGEGDRVSIPRDCNGVDQGTWEVADADTNGGGETTLLLRRWVGP